MQDRAVDFLGFLCKEQQEQVLNRVQFGRNSSHNSQRQLRVAPGNTRHQNEFSDPYDEVHISISELKLWIADYIDSCWAAEQTRVTIEGKEEVFKKLLWFLDYANYETLGVLELRKFFVYLRKGHEDPEGRWGNPQQRKPLGRRRVEMFYIYFQTFFHWCVARWLIPLSPLDRIERPEKPKPNIKIPTEEQMMEWLNAAANSAFPERNVLLLMFIFDTGLRASELCNLKMSEIDTRGLVVHVVEGKGRKDRTVYFSPETAAAIRTYNRKYPRLPQQHLFMSLGGSTPGKPLTASGLLQIIRKLGRAAGFIGVRCSPHTLRHAYATNLIKSGCPASVVQMLLGHSTLDMTMKYTHLAQSDVAAEYRRAAPITKLVNNARKR
jgi:integrase/recombinase XerC